MVHPSCRTTSPATILSVPSFPLPRLAQPGVRRQGYTEEPGNSLRHEQDGGARADRL